MACLARWGARRRARRRRDSLGAAIEHFGVTGDKDRYELLITHNFVIGWFVRHALDAPVWRWIGLNQANCALTVVKWDSDRPPVLISFNNTGHLQLHFIRSSGASTRASASKQLTLTQPA